MRTREKISERKQVFDGHNDTKRSVYEAIVQQIKMETLEDFKIKLKAQEIKKDDCIPTQYGLEEQAIEQGWKCKKVKFIITYYYADSTPLQGGYLDKYGKQL